MISGVGSPLCTTPHSGGNGSEGISMDVTSQAGTCLCRSGILKNNDGAGDRAHGRKCNIGTYKCGFSRSTCYSVFVYVLTYAFTDDDSIPFPQSVRCTKEPKNVSRRYELSAICRAEQSLHMRHMWTCWSGSTSRTLYIRQDGEQIIRLHG